MSIAGSGVVVAAAVGGALLLLAMEPRSTATRFECAVRAFRTITHASPAMAASERRAAAPPVKDTKRPYSPK